MAMKSSRNIRSASCSQPARPFANWWQRSWTIKSKRCATVIAGVGPLKSMPSPLVDCNAPFTIQTCKKAVPTRIQCRMGISWTQRDNGSNEEHDVMLKTRTTTRTSMTTRTTMMTRTRRTWRTVPATWPAVGKTFAKATLMRTQVPM